MGQLQMGSGSGGLGTHAPPLHVPVPEPHDMPSVLREQLWASVEVVEEHPLPTHWEVVTVRVCVPVVSHSSPSNVQDPQGLTLGPGQVSGAMLQD